VHLALAELRGIKCVFKVLSFLFVVHLEDAHAPRRSTPWYSIKEQTWRPKVWGTQRKFVFEEFEERGYVQQECECGIAT